MPVYDEYGRLQVSITGITGGAPNDAQYVVMATNVNLSAERVLTAGAGLTLTDGGANGNATLDVGAGSGITVNANDVALTTPGTLTVSTTNSATGNHTHAITSSSNPGAAASILASSAAGLLTLVNLNLSATSNQIVLQSAGITGTLTWTPTTAGKVITLPDLTGTTALGAGTLTVSSANSVAVADHTHAITSSANPGAAAALLASASDGGLQLLRLGIGADPDTNNRITMVDGGQIGQTAGPLIEFDDTNNYLEITGCNVGIGTTGPGQKLSVDGKIGITLGQAIELDRANEGYQYIVADATNLDVVSGGNRALRLWGDRGVTLRAYDGVAWRDRVYVEPNNGNVGIGTTGPGALLNLAGINSVAELRLSRTNSVGVGSEMGNIVFRAPNAVGTDKSWAIIRDVVTNATAGAEASDLAFNLMSAGIIDERVRITGAGNIGIGTTGPSNLAHFATDPATTSTIVDVLRLDRTTTGTAANGIGTGFVLYSEDASGNVEEAGRFQALFTTAAHATQVGRVDITAMGAATGVHVTSAGNVGVGTTTFGSSAAKVLGLTNSATAPSTSTDLVHLYAEDISAGNAALAVFQESAVATAVAIASTHKWPIRINGATYYALLTNVA